MLWVMELVQRNIRDYEKKFDEAEWWTRLQNKPSPKGKRKTKTVNQKPVKIKKMYALPREALWTMKSSKLLKTVMIPSIEKDLSQEV